MSGRHRSTHAVAAWLVMASLLAPGSLGARTSCGVCPTDCPMHRVVAAPEGHGMPCHRVARASDASGERSDEPIVRAACGQSATGDLVVHLRDRAPGTTASLPPPALAPPACGPARAPAVRAIDVPIPPPRDGRSA